ncbi:MAG: phosphoenolpyruvate--protein phosphotransferase [Chelatococcus sp.]|jgi:phosphotransferase system enzyme I (PtsP)|uniref:phosphoenolpyruvate--protein phosphotransferase n=1 Tax=unclassified Chelatococcus TaxID=2638111 RepID=UPI001BCDC4C8|nr:MULTISPECIES: phosphoenolpyruvate--protein phosphotransferase [unclassified Chelatococcus]CAH1659928.1 Phosphocarrier protein kinase/phosphorylase, nitrogen regulation associated [Hyphomicrobiales bacterium]MBS7741012.1 phosphoenolpyruvate--protein phosphotransferase [Chelatococcus sp. HY11]MBX3536710.1 phosphoenolpyruvate--protein phosphotransferase [Chelatococcus sp.]MBX3545198.1 phosphoenolpyruvate--protein phosphotransferase [Chelatococcus sp.]MCO5077831.1 phosphoenolpyruvate--protein p
MRGALGGPRVLLRRLREVMAEPVSAQDRLDRIVVLIAANMVAEVCSVYVMRTDGTLELYATEGLKREAVHLTTMSSGEGLVGLIAREAEPLALPDAQVHPAYSYKPETGEEIYHAFLGVPILRAGNTLGVLVVQNKTHRVYHEEEIEALQITAMIIAEMIASGELQALARPGADIAIRRSFHQRGVALADGVGLGHVVLHEPRVVVKDLIAENVEGEVKRLEDAIAVMRADIDRLLERGDVAHHGEHRDVLETVRMFANDKGWIRRIREAVTTGLTAEAAVERIQSDTRAKILRQTDPYLRERLHDLEDLADRLLHVLAGAKRGATREDLPENAILVARSMGPAALLDYDRSRLRGLVLEEGGPSSHIAIVARALGIPAVSRVEGIAGLVEAGDAIIVDGGAGDVQIRPAPDIEAAYAEKARLRARRQEQYRSLRGIPAITRDGTTITLQLNAGLLVDLPNIVETGATGIGLFRTELQFMVSERMPSTSDQQTLYRQVLVEAGGTPVTFRTLDIGGDKVLPYMQAAEEENPALGWRAIRIGLDRPGLLRSQLRALLKAGSGYHLKIMFPMVATVEEFLRAKSMVGREQAYLRKYGHPEPESVSLGVMVEVPSLLFQLDEIASHADFLSVGSNDLLQFLFAADRDNKQVSDRFDPLSAPALRALRSIAETAGRHNCPVTLCGEVGGRPLEAMALIGIGYRAFSMTPASVGPVKAMLLELNVSELANTMTTLLGASEKGSLRPALAAFAAAHGLPVQ